MIKNYALVNKDTNLVEKIVYWDGISNIVIYDLPESYELILIEDKLSMVWGKIPNSDQIGLVETVGRGSQGMIWNGEYFSQDPTNPPELTLIKADNISQI